MEFISSRENPVIREAKKLKEKKHREKKKQFFVEGLRFVQEALASGFEIPILFLSENSAGMLETAEIKREVNRNAQNVKVYILTEKIFKEISSTENPQGIAAIVNFKKLEPKFETEGFYVLADRIQDPGNLGTIIRSAHAAGALGVIVTKGTVDVFNEKTLRSTMGSVFHVPVIEDYNFSYVDKLRKSGFKLAAALPDEAECVFQAVLVGPVIIAVGNEGSGLSESIIENADIRVRIPMPGGAESLNVAAAASIMMFEAVRQRIAEGRIQNI